MRKSRQIIVAVICALGLLSAAPLDSADTIEVLIRAYPECLIPSDKPNTVLWKDGTEMPFDDGIQKTGFEDLLNRASLSDQMSIPYPRSWPAGPPAGNADPGRVRNEAFFRKMYGDTREQVRSNLVSVDWFGGTSVTFTSVNGAARALCAVREDLQKMPTEVQRYVSKPIGTFHWRPIAGTRRLSMHSFGAAIDFQLPQGLHRYWKWDLAEVKDTPTYPASILEDATLKQIVELFERHGFIWGGKWFHYDTMHFEYRPELVMGKWGD